MPRFLNGFKTVLGTLGLAVVYLSDHSTIVLLPENWRPYIAGASAVLTALGLVHKVEKKAEADKEKERASVVESDAG